MNVAGLYLILAWAGAVMVVFPVALWVAIALRERTGVSIRWRLLVCAVLGCALAPSMLVDVKGGPVPLPAVLVGWIAAAKLDGLSLLIFGLAPICLVTLVLFSIWTIQLKVEGTASGRFTEKDSPRHLLQ